MDYLEEIDKVGRECVKERIKQSKKVYKEDKKYSKDYGSFEPFPSEKEIKKEKK